MNTTTNPFTNRSMIVNESDFVGREAEIAELLSRVRNLGSVSIVGERRIGKSSLLNHLCLTGNKRLECDDYRFIYIDLQDARYSTPLRFCKSVIKMLNITPDSLPTDEDCMCKLLDALDEFGKNGKICVLLIDEFEIVTNVEHKFSEEFFDSLRSAANQHKLSIVTSSQLSLKELTDKGRIVSPFWNIFANQNLGGFVVSDNTNEIHEFISKLWLNRLKPSADELNFLLSYCSVHPIISQIVSYWVFENRRLNLDEDKLKKKIEDETTSYFRSNNAKIIKWLKTNMPPFITTVSDYSEKIGKIGKQLSPLSINIGAKE